MGFLFERGPRRRPKCAAGQAAAPPKQPAGFEPRKGAKKGAALK